MMEELKYKPKKLWTFSVICWSIITIVNIYLFFIIFRLMNMWMLILFFFLSVINPILMIVYYIHIITKRNYLYIDIKGISIDRGLIIPRRFIRYKDIIDVRKKGHNLRIKLVSGKTINVRLQLLSFHDGAKLNKILEHKIIKVG